MKNASPTSSADPELPSPLLPSSKEPTWKADTGPEPQKLTTDDMLQKYCGEFGRWQLRHFVLASLAWALQGLHTMVMIYADREPDFRCVGPGCADGAKSVCGLDPASWEWVDGAGSSTVAQWGLVCGQRFKIGLVQAVFFGG